MEQSTENGPLGSNPFRRDDPRYKVWRTASLYAEEEWERFLAEHRAALPAESEDLKVFAEWRLSSVVGKFDIQAKYLCGLVLDYEDANSYKEALKSLADSVLSRASKASHDDPVGRLLLPELKFRLGQRQNHWRAEALKLAREYEQSRKARAHRETQAANGTLAAVEHPAPPAEVDPPNESACEGEGTFRAQQRESLLSSARERWSPIAEKIIPFSWIHRAAGVDHKDAYDWKTGKLPPSSMMSVSIERILKEAKPPKDPREQ